MPVKVADPDPARFMKEIAHFSFMRADPNDPRESMLCIGSSSFRFWDAQAAFPEYQVFNCGFGGSEFSDANALWTYVSPPVNPSVVLVYEGDNDTAATHKPVPQIYEDFVELMGRIMATYPYARIVIVPTKPSPDRVKAWPAVAQLNEMMACYAADHERIEIVADLPGVLKGGTELPLTKYYKKDMVHLNEEGYAIWNERIRAVVLKAQ